MPRPLRITVPNLPFHIIDRGNNRQIVFREEKDFIYFLQLVKRYKKELEFKLYHFCLMSNHIHFVMKPTIEGSLANIMMRLTLAYSSYFNKKYSGVGHVWQGRYKSSLIDKDSYFIHCSLYAELNPVRANIVARPQDWRWSSYNFYAFGEKNDEIGQLIKEIIDVDPYYLQLRDDLQERRKEYRENVKRVMEHRFLKQIRKDLDEGVFGSTKFIEEMRKKYKIKSLRGRGRPRKEK